MSRYFLLLCLLVPVLSRAAVVGMNGLDVCFTNAVTITNLTWSGDSRFTITNNGLGWAGGASQETHEFWMQSAPVAIGLSWRPAAGANVTVEISPGTKPVQLANGQTWTPYGGQAFVRYSPDKLHWSSWQALERTREPETNRVFHGLIEVPQAERERYANFVSAYSTNDVPWVSDEEAVVKWILAKEPDFFAKQIPFVGYVEFRFEDSMPGGQRIERVKLQLGWGVGGLHSIPKEPDTEKGREGAWRFEAHSVAKTEMNQ